MGRSIVYCDKCGQLLREEHFQKGKAFVADNRNYCADCRPAGMPTPPPQPPASKISSSRIPKQAAPQGISSSRVLKQPQNESRRIPSQPAAPGSDSAGASTARIIAIAVAGVVVALAAAAALFSGGKKEARKTEQSTPSPVVVAVPPPKVENLAPAERRREEAAREACVKAYEAQTLRPKDLAAQWRAFEAAVAASQGTSYAGDAAAQLARIRRSFEEERSAVEARAQEALAREQFKPALEIWDEALRKYDVAEWTRPLNSRIEELKADFERRLGVLRDAATEARKRGDEAETRKIRERVATWGLGGYAERIDQALAVVVPDKRDPPPAAEAAKAVDAYRARWKELLAPAAGRELAELVRAMEKLAAETKDEAKKEAADDLENLRLAASVIQESAPLLTKLAKGQRIALSYWDSAGGPARAEESILKIDAHRIEIKMGESSFVVPIGELTSATLVDLFRTRPARKDSDNRAAVVACLLDGDGEGAQRFRGEVVPQINGKYDEIAKDLAGRRVADEKEKAARSLFYEAERSYFDYGEMVGAVAKYRTLLADHAATAFVKRNRAAIAARAEGGPRDFLFGSGDLTITAGFKLGKYGKIDAAWTSQQDVEPEQVKANYLQVEFSATPEHEYRCWILAGGCCQEVFTFQLQGTELQGPDPAKPKEKISAEPGGPSTLIVKSTNSSIKKLHSMHNGPKSPERFDWIQAGSFKYPTAGTKLMRILTNQKGFAVANVAILATRPGPPRDLEFKEFEKWKAETPGASLKQGGVVTGSILREVFKNINGTTIGELTATPGFKEDRPDERGLLTSFEAPKDIGDNYGTRIRGYVHPPLSGAYVFWIASDDYSELWLSTDEDPAHKERIAHLGQYASPREYDKVPEQKSKAIELKAGRRYYIEALHKEGGGGDHVSVKWMLPSGQEELPIPGNRLSPFAPPKK